MRQGQADDTTAVPPRPRYPLSEITRSQLASEQLALFSVEALQAKRTRDFDPRLTDRGVADGSPVVAVDIGGDKIAVASYVLRDGSLVLRGEPAVHHGTGGSGYLSMLEEAAALARSMSAPLGISYAGPVQDARVLAGINVPVFFEELGLRFGGDLAKLHATVSLVNDGEAGVLASSVAAVSRDQTTRHVVYVINGSGLNAALFSNNVIVATEAGHIPVVAQLNPFGQAKPCGMLGATYVCLESVGASRAGIEDLWLQQRGERADGKAIAAAYLNGDGLAGKLYADSALVTAHLVRGIADTFGVTPECELTTVVGHGGTFEVPGYAERVSTILEESFGKPTRMLLARDFSANACLDGAAVAALLVTPTH